MSQTDSQFLGTIREPKEASHPENIYCVFSQDPVKGHYMPSDSSGHNGSEFKSLVPLIFEYKELGFVFVSVDNDPHTNGWIDEKSIYLQGTIEGVNDFMIVTSEDKSEHKLQNDTPVALLGYDNENVVIGFVSETNNIMKALVRKNFLRIRRNKKTN